MKYQLFVKNLSFAILVLIISACSNQNALKTLPDQSTAKPTTANQPFSEDLAQFTGDADLQHAGISFKAIDLRTGQVLAKFNPKQSLTPASNTKLFTTAVALEILPRDMRFETQLAYRGKLKNGVLDGDLYIIGGGDATLGSQYFHDNREQQQAFLATWLAEIKKKGIRQINGRLIANRSIFEPYTLSDAWEWGDLGYDYAAAPNALSVFDNIVNLKIVAPEHLNQNASIVEQWPSTPDTQWQTDIKSVAKGDKKSLSYYNVPYQNVFMITGQLPVQYDTFDTNLSLPDPSATLASEFEQQLKQAGIAIEQKISVEDSPLPKELKVFYRHRSPPLHEIIRQTNVESVNLFAEQLVYFFDEEGQPKRYRVGRERLNQFWRERLGEKGLYINDASGLSRYNTVNAEQVTGLLAYMYKSKHFGDFYHSLATSGQNGTLKNLGRDSILAGNFRGKTGTMTRVEALSGYLTSQSGKMIAVSILVNHSDSGNKATLQKMASLIVAVAEDF